MLGTYTDNINIINGNYNTDHQSLVSFPYISSIKTIGPLAADHIGLSDVLSPFTVGIFLIGAAVSSVPSGWLFRKYGRAGGFSIGCWCQVAGSVCGGFAMIVENAFFLFTACFFIGLGQVCYVVVQYE